MIFFLGFFFAGLIPWLLWNRGIINQNTHEYLFIGIAIFILVFGFFFGGTYIWNSVNEDINTFLLVFWFGSAGAWFYFGEKDLENKKMMFRFGVLPFGFVAVMLAVLDIFNPFGM